MNRSVKNEWDPAGYAFVPAIISTDISRISNGTNFVVSADNGDIQPRTYQGFYAHDTRFLSRYTLTVNGKRLASTGHATFEETLASFYCAVGLISIVRDRYVSASFHEDISLTNYSFKTVKVDFEVALDADFADVFEVRRGTIIKTGETAVAYSAEKGITIAYRRAEFLRETRVEFSMPARFADNTARFTFTLEPKAVWKTCVAVRPVIDTHVHAVSPCVGEILGEPLDVSREKAFLGFFQEVESGMPLEKIPVLKTGNLELSQAFHRAVGDLRALRLQQDEGFYVLAAGLPWFMAVFGRDSVISAIQTKLLGPELMIGTLRTLARLQARETDDFREAEPGKIIHEVRKGELSLFGHVPHTRYYGSVDATPLFIILLREAYEWTGDRKLLEEYLPPAERALAWIDSYGDLDGDGFIEYRRRVKEGLLNQGWKDSNDSVSFQDGTLAAGPIALAEVQGYAYAARMDMAAIYGALGKYKNAEAQKKRAGQLKKQFNDAFWMPEKGFYALALDGKKRQVDSISSNPGHCLWSGIIADDKAGDVARRLMAPDMFSGWGIRTLSSESKRFNPLSYHNGSIWPHDNSIIAAGLERYGFKKEAKRIATAIIEATAVLPAHRLPELFAGYTRRAYSFPVPYPTANSPQAWASGALIFLMETLLEISPGGDTLVSSPPVKKNPVFTLSDVWYRHKKQALP